MMNESAPLSAGGHGRRGRLVAGGVLLAVALLALAAPHLPWSWNGRGMLAVLGVGFIVWAALARTSGLLVPGGVLLGVGVGLWLQPVYGPAAFLFAMSGGFLAISALALLLFGRANCAGWTVYPAGGLALAGLVVTGGPEVRTLLRAARDYWPYAVIVVAAVLIVTGLRKNP